MYHVYHMEGGFTHAGFVPLADRNLISFYPLSHQHGCCIPFSQK